MTQWSDIFHPLLTAGSEIRPQQTLLGQSIIDSLATRTNLLAEAPTGTGKSISYLLPIINAIKTAPRGKKIRAAVSTETTSLQDQVALKDLPFLHNIYGGFTFRVLKGRSNYLCLNALRLNARGNAMAAKYLETIERQLSRVGDGERRDINNLLKTELDDHAWSFMSGSPIGCSDNSCTIPQCYSTRARALALDANIVVINHALLRVDADTIITDDTGMGDNFLGPLDYLIVDEAHTLAGVLVDGWTEDLSEWEINDLGSKISVGVDKAKSVINNPGISYTVQQITDDTHDFIRSTINFYSLLHQDKEWKQVGDSLSLKNIMASSSPQLIRAMHVFEDDGPVTLQKTIDSLELVKKYLNSAIVKAIDEEMPGLRKIRKGLRAAKDLQQVLKRILEAMRTKDGIIVDYGVPYGAIVSGFNKRDGSASLRLSITPLDVSSMAKVMWENRICILVSATLKDLTDGSFTYMAASVGLPDYVELRTDSPFDFAQQQIVYVTPGAEELVDVVGARYSFNELVALLHAASGRTLALFTARKELDDAAFRLRQLAADGAFPYPILVQESDANKQRLVEEFRSQEHSVLLATKSFFTGVDFPGNTCSMVVICKFPLPQFNTLCKMQISWWRRKGFSRWYEREALTVFQQAAGRLIRAGSDRGVVALLDTRVTVPGDRVASTARMGVESLGSGVTRSIEDVRVFLS